MACVFYSLDEAAGIARCSKKTLQRAIRNAQLRAFKPGRCLVIQKTDFDAWIKSTVVVPAADPRARESAVVRMIRKEGCV